MLIMLVTTLAGCGQAVPQAGDKPAVADAGETFPVQGNYHRISDRTRNGETQRMETDGPLDVSTRETFEREVAGVDTGTCRDREVAIGGGSFSVRMTCNGPHGGDVAINRQGSYSKDSLDVTYETMLDGAATQETVSYRLTKG
jgi:hypothetical protein